MKKHNVLILGFLAVVIIGESVATGLLPIARGYLFDLLSTKTGPIWVALFLYFLTYLSVDFFQSIKGYVVLKVALWYRTLRTKVVKHKLTNNSSTLPTNCPQRIQEDIKLSYVARITVWVEYCISTIILIQLIILNIHQLTLVGFALGYALLSVLIAIKFNPRLTKAEINIQQSEADYRSALVNSLLDITGLKVANKACIASKWIQTQYLLFTKLQLGLLTVLPYIILLPSYLSGTINLGQVVEHQASFALIVVNAAILIQMYPMLIQGTASEKRVREVEE